MIRWKTQEHLQGMEKQAVILSSTCHLVEMRFMCKQK